MFFVVAELNNVVLEFADVKAVMGGWGACTCCPVNYTSATPETLARKWWQGRPEASLKGGEPELHERVSSQKGQKWEAPGIITQQRIYAPRSSHIWVEFLRTDHDNFDLWSNSYTSELRAKLGIMLRCLYLDTWDCRQKLCSLKKRLPSVDCKVRLDKESPYIFKN